MTFDARDSAGFRHGFPVEGDGGLKSLPCKADVDSPSAAPRTTIEREVLAYFCKGYELNSIVAVTGLSHETVFDITSTRATASEHELRRRALKLDTRVQT